MSKADGKRFDIMATAPCQIIISDIRMPGIDGIELMARLKKTHPETLRLILCAHADRDSITESVGTVDQLLVKPCDREMLISVIEGFGFKDGRWPRMKREPSMK